MEDSEGTVKTDGAENGIAARKGCCEFEIKGICGGKD
jgi:hypothetical protein